MRPHQDPGRLPPLVAQQFDAASAPEALDELVACARDHGDIFRVWSPVRKSDTWIVNNPDDIKHILVSNHRNFTKGSGLDRVRILLGNGIMTSEGDMWRRQRRMIQPMFHRRVVEQFAALIERCVATLQQRWRVQSARGEPIDLTEEMSTLTLDIVLESIFGRDLGWLAEKAGGNPFSIVTEHSARDLQFAYRFRSLAKLVGTLVEKRRAGNEEHFDFVAMLMAATDKDTGQPMAPRELIDEVMTLVVAGHETTAAALNWTWYLLSQHPRAEAALHAELATLPDGPLSYQDSEALLYTQSVLKEAMRLYPPGWLLSRRTIEADELSGYTVPAGTDVMLSPYLIQRHAAHWPEPDRFDPGRFAPEMAEARNKWVYIPFAAGPRHCVGENFALYEMTVHLARMAKAWRLRYVDDGPIEIEAAINLRPRRNLRMRLEPR